jgi:hypothetical protein
MGIFLDRLILAMYSQLARSASGLTLRTTIRTYATRRVIRETSSNPLITPSRSFQSTGHFQGQVHAEVPAYSAPFDHGVIGNGDFSSTFLTSPSSVAEAITLEHPVSRPSFTPEEVTSVIDFDESVTQDPVLPLYHRGSKFDREPYWQKISRWKDVAEKEFLTHSWQVRFPSPTIIHKSNLQPRQRKTFKVPQSFTPS